MSSLDLFAARRTDLGFRRFGTFNVTLILSWLVIAVVIAWAVAPGVFTPHSGTVGIAGQQLRAPDGAHWLGTDEIGRDVLARIIYGAANSLAGAVVAVAVGLIAGTALGLVAGAVGGRTDAVIMRVVDVLLSVPGLLLQLSIIIILGFGTVNVAVAIIASPYSSKSRSSVRGALRYGRSRPWSASMPCRAASKSSATNRVSIDTTAFT